MAAHFHTLCETVGFGALLLVLFAVRFCVSAQTRGTRMNVREM